MIRFAGTGPQYVTHASAQVAGAHAHRGIVATIGRRTRKSHDVEQSGRAPVRIAERDVLNVDSEPPGRMSAAAPDQLDRGRTGENAETLDEWAVSGARRLSGGKAGAHHRITSLADQTGSRPAEKPLRLLVAADHDAVRVNDKGRVPDGINIDHIPAPRKI
jgi:hypothetical protein